MSMTIYEELDMKIFCKIQNYISLIQDNYEIDFNFIKLFLVTDWEIKNQKSNCILLNIVSNSIYIYKTNIKNIQFFINFGIYENERFSYIYSKDSISNKQLYEYLDNIEPFENCIKRFSDMNYNMKTDFKNLIYWINPIQQKFSTPL